MLISGSQAIEEQPLDPLPSGFPDIRIGRAERLRPLRQHYPIPGAIPHHVHEQDIQIPARDGTTIPARTYTPVDKITAPPKGRPLYVAYHEGGWALGDLTDEDMNCRLYARDLGAVCVNVDYRLAPEHQFPVGIKDCWDALQWIAKHAYDLGANPKAGFIIGGASAGGNISAVLAHLARDEKLDPPLTGHHLVCPALLPPAYVPEKYKHLYISYTENDHDPVLGGNKFDKGLYEAPIVKEVVKADLDDPLINVFANKSGQEGLPACYLQVCGLDPLRDEGLIYERVLREDVGLKTRIDVYPGFGHMCKFLLENDRLSIELMTNFFCLVWTNYPKMKRSDEFVNDALQGVKWLLDTTSTGD